MSESSFVQSVGVLKNIRLMKSCRQQTAQILSEVTTPFPSFTLPHAFAIYWLLKVFYKSCHIHTVMAMKLANLLIISNLGLSVLLKYTMTQGIWTNNLPIAEGLHKRLLSLIRKLSKRQFGAGVCAKGKKVLVTKFYIHICGNNYHFVHFYVSMWSCFTSMSEMADSRAQLQLTKPSERWIRPESHSLTKASVTALLKSWNYKKKKGNLTSINSSMVQVFFSR